MSSRAEAGPLGMGERGGGAGCRVRPKKQVLPSWPVPLCSTCLQFPSGLPGAAAQTSAPPTLRGLGGKGRELLAQALAAQTWWTPANRKWSGQCPSLIHRAVGLPAPLQARSGCSWPQIMLSDLHPQLRESRAHIRRPPSPSVPPAGGLMGGRWGPCQEPKPGLLFVLLL